MPKSLDSVTHEEKQAEHIEALQQLVNDMHEEMEGGFASGGNDYYDAWQVFGKRLQELAK